MQTPGSSSCHLRFFFGIWWKIIVKICTCHSFASNYSSYFSYNICTWFVVVDILVFCLPYFLTAVQVIVELRSKRPYLPLKCPAIGMALGVGPQSHYNQIQKCYYKYKYRNATYYKYKCTNATTNTNTEMPQICSTKAAGHWYGTEYTAVCGYQHVQKLINMLTVMYNV